jgi:hypothetical protein
MLFRLKAQITNVEVFLRDINFEISTIPSNRENKIDVFVQKRDLSFQEKEIKPDSTIKLSHILVDRFGQGTVTYSKNINKLIISFTFSNFTWQDLGDTDEQRIENFKNNYKINYTIDINLKSQFIEKFSNCDNTQEIVSRMRSIDLSTAKFWNDLSQTENKFLKSVEDLKSLAINKYELEQLNVYYESLKAFSVKENISLTSKIGLTIDAFSKYKNIKNLLVINTKSLLFYNSKEIDPAGKVKIDELYFEPVEYQKVTKIINQLEQLGFKKESQNILSELNFKINKLVDYFFTNTNGVTLEESQRFIKIYYDIRKTKSDVINDLNYKKLIELEEVLKLIEKWRFDLNSNDVKFLDKTIQDIKVHKTSSSIFIDKLIKLTLDTKINAANNILIHDKENLEQKKKIFIDLIYKLEHLDSAWEAYNKLQDLEYDKFSKESEYSELDTKNTFSNYKSKARNAKNEGLLLESYSGRIFIDYLDEYLLKYKYYISHEKVDEYKSRRDRIILNLKAEYKKVLSKNNGIEFIAELNSYRIENAKYKISIGINPESDLIYYLNSLYKNELSSINNKVFNYQDSSVQLKPLDSILNDLNKINNIHGLYSNYKDNTESIILIQTSIMKCIPDIESLAQCVNSYYDFYESYKYFKKISIKSPDFKNKFDKLKLLMFTVNSKIIIASTGNNENYLFRDYITNVYSNLKTKLADYNKDIIISSRGLNNIEP